MHFIYIDDSGDQDWNIFSALVIPAENWQESLQLVKDFRRGLKRDHGIGMRKELHAWKFVTGRGNISDRIVTKYERSLIFTEAIKLVASLPGARLFNTCFSHGEGSMTAFERLLNRINRTMKECDSHALIISDRGKEHAYTRLARKMGVFNPIPSAHGEWETGSKTKNIPISNILEDIVFKDSEVSFFIQLVDFCAYSLLRREHPLESRNRYDIDKAFDHLSEILVLEASGRDPEGIIRGNDRTPRQIQLFQDKLARKRGA